MLTHLAVPEGNELGGHFQHTIKHQFIDAEVLQGTTVVSHTTFEAEENKTAQARTHSFLFVRLAISSSMIFILEKLFETSVKSDILYPVALTSKKACMWKACPTALAQL